MKINIASVLAFALIFFAFGFFEPVKAQRYKKKPPVENADEPARDSTARQKFFDRLVFGGNLVAGFGSSTYIDISPLVGYKINPRLIGGIGVTYIYYRFPIIDPYTNQEVG